jgi:hypothetical protein
VRREEALDAARGRLFELRALSTDTLRRRAEQGRIDQEEAGSGPVHCRLILVRYESVQTEGGPAVRVSVNVEDGGWAVLDEHEVAFVRTLPEAETDAP